MGRTKDQKEGFVHPMCMHWMLYLMPIQIHCKVEYKCANLLLQQLECFIKWNVPEGGGGSTFGFIRSA